MYNLKIKTIYLFFYMFPLPVTRGWQAEETCSKLWWWSVNIYVLKSLLCPASVYKIPATRGHTNDS